MDNYQIVIGGYDSPKDFVEIWAKRYHYPNYEKYTKHIDTAISDTNSLRALFEWKNGTSDKISALKSIVIDGFVAKREKLNYLQQSHVLDWQVFEEEFEPQKSSAIWKIFLLHMLNPKQHPIFDQHVHRSFCFFTEGKIKELPKTSKQVYQIYKDHYLPWALDICSTHDIEVNQLDKALFAFGKTLKGLDKLPIEIPTQPK